MPMKFTQLLLPSLVYPHEVRLGSVCRCPPPHQEEGTDLQQDSVKVKSSAIMNEILTTNETFWLETIFIVVWLYLRCVVHCFYEINCGKKKEKTSIGKSWDLCVSPLVLGKIQVTAQWIFKGQPLKTLEKQAPICGTSTSGDETNQPYAKLHKASLRTDDSKEQQAESETSKDTPAKNKTKKDENNSWRQLEIFELGSDRNRKRD